MKNKYVFVGLMLGVMILIGVAVSVLGNGGDNEQKEEIKVVTSFYPVYIATINLTDGVEGIVVENLSEPQTGCLHDYQLTPNDMTLLSTADLFIINGGGIESFLEDALAEYPQLAVAEACEGMELLEDNAHAWMSPSLYEQQIRNIASGIIDAAPDKKDEILANEKKYLEKIDGICMELEQLRAKYEGKDLIIFHAAYAYLAQELGMDVVYCMDLDEERKISAGEVAEVVGIIRDNGINLVLAEERYGRDMGDVVEAETGISVFYLDTLVRGEYDKDSYVTAMKENIRLLKEALAE